MKNVKKLLALLLALCMVVALVACGSSSSDTAEDTSEPAEVEQEEEAEAPAEEEAAAPAEEVEEEEAPAEEAVDFTWNGQMEVWSILPTTGAEGLVMINDAMGDIMQQAGFTYVKKDAEGNPMNQVDFVQNAIDAGNVGCLMIAAMSVDMLADVCQEAIDAGIAIVMLGAQPEYQISGCVYTAYEITGMEAVLAAEDWVLNRVAEGGNVPTNADGKYEIALDIYLDIADGVYRSNAMHGTVEASDVLANVSETTSYGDSAYSDAYSNAQDVLNANPNCHIFVCYEPEESMGTADAIEAYANDNGLDLADYCVISCYAEDTTFMEMYEDTLADPSATAIKGYANYGDNSRNGEELAGYLCTGYHLADALLYACGIDCNDSLATWGNIESGGGSYGATYYDTIVATNIYGYSFSWVNGDDNPAAAYKTAQYIG